MHTPSLDSAPSPWASLVHRELGAFENFSKINQGNRQKVFSFEARSQAWVLKLSRDPSIAVKERFASERIKGLALPRFYSSGYLEGYFWLIQSRMPGHNQTERRWSHNYPQLIELVQQLRRTAFPAPPGEAPLSLWRNEMQKILLWPQRFKHHLFWREEQQLAQELMHCIQTHLSACPALLWLIHGDITPPNILWQNDKISAVLDWQTLTVGDPLYDLILPLLSCPVDDWPGHLRTVQTHFDLAEQELISRFKVYGLHAGIKRCMWKREKLNPAQYTRSKELLRNILHF